MALTRCKPEQRRDWVFSSLLALLANQPPGAIVQISGMGEPVGFSIRPGLQGIIARWRP
jgi:hypothetical protein